MLCVKKQLCLASAVEGCWLCKVGRCLQRVRGTRDAKNALERSCDLDEAGTSPYSLSNGLCFHCFKCPPLCHGPSLLQGLRVENLTSSSFEAQQLLRAHSAHLIPNTSLAASKLLTFTTQTSASFEVHFLQSTNPSSKRRHQQPSWVFQNSSDGCRNGILPFRSSSRTTASPSSIACTWT